MGSQGQKWQSRTGSLAPKSSSLSSKFTAFLCKGLLRPLLTGTFPDSVRRLPFTCAAGLDQMTRPSSQA